MADHPRILMLGGGNMGRALVGGLIRDGHPVDHIAVSDPDPECHRMLAETYGLKRLYHENTRAYSEVEPQAMIFAIKPDRMATTATDLAPWVVTEHPLLMTLAAGVRAEDVARWTGGHCPVVRVMPNTPALVGFGMSALYAHEEVSEAQQRLAEMIMGCVGQTLWVRDETLMDAVTAVSGSGPAYFFAFMEALGDAAQALGLSGEQADILVLETARGAIELASTSEESLADLRRKVTSKGGTTEAALQVLEAGEFAVLIQKALKTASTRARQLGDESARS